MKIIGLKQYDDLILPGVLRRMMNFTSQMLQYSDKFRNKVPYEKKSNLIPVILLKFNFFKKEELPSKKCGVGAFGLCLKLRARIDSVSIVKPPDKNFSVIFHRNL